MQIYWQGYGGSKHLAEELRSLIESLDCTLTTISEWDDSDIKWNRHTWLQHLRQADCIIIPQDYQLRPAKSANRLTQSMSLGKPCIVSPLPEYLRIIEKYPGCALIATTQEEWKQHIEYLKNPTHRQEISKIALEASKEFSLGEITKKWVSLFQDLEKTDIIIPTYNNLPCLKLCLESIRACTTCLYNVVVVDNGSNIEVQKYLESQGDIVYIKKDRMNFAQAINIGLRVSTSKYVCILNDDVIVSRNWLESMIEVCQDGVGAVGPLSNCDKGWLHNYDIQIGGINLLPGIHTVPEIIPIIGNIYSYKSPYNEVREQNWVAFYCTLMTREVVQKVGLLDEQSFNNSGEDVDFSYRIKRMGYRIIQNYNSFVYHFGAVGRHIVEKEDPKKYHELDDRNKIHLNDKWNKKTIVVYSGPSWEKWDYRNINSGGVGGSESWQVLLSREFSKLGFRVINFNDCPEDCQDGDIKYIHYTKFPEFVEYNWVDYFISSRTEDIFRLPIRAGKKFVMIHDIWLLSGQQIQHQDKIDKFLCLSEWHKNFVSNHHNIPLDKIVLTSNGIDLKRFDKKLDRHPARLIYSSSLDRGLDTLLYLFDFIKAEVPDLELHIFYGFDTWQKSAENRPEEKKKIENIKEMMNKDGVFFHGRVGQEQLAQEMLNATLWCYPTDFEETFCITAIECQAAGLPVICSNYAGLKTTVGESAILVGKGLKSEPYTREYRLEFVEKCIEVLTKKEIWEEWSEKSLQNARKYSWEKVAKQWVDNILE